MAGVGRTLPPKMTREPLPSQRVKLLKSCARCGGDHAGLAFRKLVHPIPSAVGGDFTHFALCPLRGEPILMRLSDPDAKAWPPLRGDDLGPPS